MTDKPFITYVITFRILYIYTMKLTFLYNSRVITSILPEADKSKLGLVRNDQSGASSPADPTKHDWLICFW
jgi:hypothetical protein